MAECRFAILPFCQSAILLILSACSDDSATVWLTLPDVQAERSMIVAAEWQRSPLMVEAFDLSVAEPVLRLSGVVPPDARVRIDALLYSQSLAELEIPAGPVVAVDDNADGRSLPVASRTVSTEIIARSPTFWRPAAGPSTGVSDLRIAPPGEKCRSFVATSVPIDGDGGVEYVVPIDETSALALTEEGDLARVSLDGTAERVTPSGNTSRVRSIVKDDAGAWWAGGQRGEVWRATLDGPTFEVRLFARTSTGVRVRSLAIADEAREIYALGDVGNIERYDGTRFVMIHQFPNTTSANGRGKVLRIGPNEMIAGQESSMSVLYYHDGDTDVTRPEFFNSGVGAIGLSELGIVVASTVGDLYRFDAGRWIHLDGEVFQLTIHNVVDYPRGFVYSGANGWIGQYLNGRYCPIEDIAPNTVFSMARVGTTLVCGVERKAPDRAVVTLVVPRE